MKKIASLLAFSLVIACKPYRVTCWNYEIPLTKYSQIDKASTKLNSFKDLPRRIRNIYEFKEQAVTIDSSGFNASPHTTSLFLYGAYDKKEKVGYVIQRFYDQNKTTSNQCSLFIVRGDSLTFDFYGTPKNALLWAEIEPYLKRPIDKLFGGGTAVFKTKKKN